MIFFDFRSVRSEARAYVARQERAQQGKQKIIFFHFRSVRSEAKKNHLSASPHSFASFYITVVFLLSKNTDFPGSRGAISVSEFF